VREPGFVFCFINWIIWSVNIEEMLLCKGTEQYTYDKLDHIFSTASLMLLPSCVNKWHLLRIKILGWHWVIVFAVLIAVALRVCVCACACVHVCVCVFVCHIKLSTVTSGLNISILQLVWTECKVKADEQKVPLILLLLLSPALFFISPCYWTLNLELVWAFVSVVLTCLNVRILWGKN
jgi:hypothetical protein